MKNVNIVIIAMHYYYLNSYLLINFKLNKLFKTLYRKLFKNTFYLKHFVVRYACFSLKFW